MNKNVFCKNGSGLFRRYVQDVLKRELALDGVAVAVERNSTKALAFKLTVGSKTMELTAQNADELEQWIDVFSRTNDA